jgi:lipoic acid synthetase
MTRPDHNPLRRRLHLPIVGVANGPGDLGTYQPGERKPPWLKVRIASGPNYTELKALMRNSSLHTVCEEAMCPNIGECWEEREATFLILGTKCTRRCGFCDVMTAKPDPVDEEEPVRIARAVGEMGLRYVVLTGVARDDLPDGGASIWAATVRAVRAAVPGVAVEVLPSDFKGGHRDIATVLDSEPEVFAHNLETIRRLHSRIRPAFGYERSLEVLRFVKEHRPGQVTKSNLILGMGERHEEIQSALEDLVQAGVDILTVGQYLQPTKYHLPVDRWVAPEEFADLKRLGEELGIGHVEAGPLVRSSYHAGNQLRRAVDKGVAKTGSPGRPLPREPRTSGGRPLEAFGPRSPVPPAGGSRSRGAR